MSVDVLDLDVLRPEKRIVRIGGHDIDVSFVPLAITWDVDELVRELMQYGDQEEVAKDAEKTKAVLKLSCKLCAVFSSWQYPELDEKWFENNMDAAQLNMFVPKIQETLERSYNGIEAYQKNGEAAKAKKAR